MMNLKQIKQKIKGIIYYINENKYVGELKNVLKEEKEKNFIK